MNSEFRNLTLCAIALLLLMPYNKSGQPNDEELEISRRRYLKGLDMLRLLNEKILALDHHFYAMQTGQRVLELGNPNSFPEFQKNWETLTNQQARNQALPPSLSENPYALSTLSLLGAYQARGKLNNELQAVACILDFTLQLQTDLRLIHIENEMLCRDIQLLRSQCAQLFQDYVQPLAYHHSLEHCRQFDDWDKLVLGLDVYLKDLSARRQQPGQLQEAYRQHIHLEFSVDRLLEFIRVYTAFIRQSVSYYLKFDAVLEDYATGNPCTEQMPPRFHRLREDLKQAVQKFNEAYDVAELQGSRMKDLLYGFAD